MSLYLKHFLEEEDNAVARAILASRGDEERERELNVQLLMHLRSRPEFAKSAEMFLREAQGKDENDEEEEDAGKKKKKTTKKKIPTRMDLNGFEREMSVKELEGKFFGGDLHGNTKKRDGASGDGIIQGYDATERGRAALRNSYSHSCKEIEITRGKKNPLAMVARGGRRFEKKRWSDFYYSFECGETAFTGKCANKYFGNRFECQRALHAHRDACYCAVYNRTGDKLVTGADDWLVKIWNARNGRLLASCRGHTEPITIVEICPRDYLIASGSIDKDVRTWKLETGEPVSVLRGHFMPITVVLFNPAKPWILASASEDGTVRLWHAYKHSGEQSAAVLDVHSMVSGPQVAAENNIEGNGNENNNNGNNINPSEEQQQQQQQQQQHRQARVRGRPRTQLTRVVTLSFNCDGTALCGGTDTCHIMSSRLFCYGFDLSKVNEESEGEAPSLSVLCAYDMTSNYDMPSDQYPTHTHTRDVDVTKFSNADPRTFISGSSDGSVICWQIPLELKGNDGIKLTEKSTRADRRVHKVWHNDAYDGSWPTEVYQAVWTKDDRYVIATYACTDPIADKLPAVRLIDSRSGKEVCDHVCHSKPAATLEPHPFYPEIYLTGGHDGYIKMWHINDFRPIREFFPAFQGIQVVEIHWNPDGLSFVASDAIGNCYFFGVGDNKRYLRQKREQFFSVEFIPESNIARDEHGVARVYQDPPANLVYGETLFERYCFESEVLCDQMGDPYSVAFVDAFKKDENLEKYFSAIPSNPSEREFEGVWQRKDGCQLASRTQLMISHRYNNPQQPEFILGDDPILDNDDDDEANDPDDVERDPDIVISDDDDDDDDDDEENDANVFGELEDSDNVNNNASSSDDDDWAVNNQRRTRRRRAENRARVEAAANRRRLRRATRRSYAESETDTEEEEEYESYGDEEEEARPRTRRRRSSQQLNSESEEDEPEEEEEEEENRRPARLTFVMGPAKRSEQCFSWLLREFQGYGCYVPQLGDSVMYIPQGHEEFLDAMNDTLSSRVWEEKEDVRFCEPCVVSDLKYIINSGSEGSITDSPYETICELTLRFADPRSANFGETFSLKLPRLSVADFIVCMDRFIAAREKKWKANDQNVFCLWDWEIEDEQHPGHFGTWWHGEISSVVKNEGRWRGSPWNNLRITYSNQANETVTHCFWELFDADDKVRWRRATEARQRNRASDCLLGPALTTEVTRALTARVEKLIADDRFLAYVTDASCDDVYLREALNLSANYCKIVPLPMSLERIKHRLKGRYYRQLDAFKSDVDLIWSNAALFHGPDSSFEAVAKEIREELLRDIEENDFVADTHEIHLNFPSYGKIVKENKNEEKEEETRMITEEETKEEDEEEKKNEEDEQEDEDEDDDEDKERRLPPPRSTRSRRGFAAATEQPTMRRATRATPAVADPPPRTTRQRSSSRRSANNR